MDASSISSVIKKDIEKFLSKESQQNFEDKGVVVKITDGVATISGLRSAKVNEIILFNCGARGMVFNLDEDSVGAVIIDGKNSVKEGAEATCSGEYLTVKCGPELVGRVVNALGNPIDGKGNINSDITHGVEVPAPSIMDRAPVNIPMETGIQIIDGLIPIGRGQRELIIGDRQTGKTSIALSTMINQKRLNDRATSESQKVYCVYVAIGQKMSSIAQLVQKLTEYGVMQYSTVVVASAFDSATMQFLAPYTGCAIAEYFRDNGMHSLIVYDDLSKHAVSYREMSLLLRRPPGREAYPGDVFFIHSRLLERAAQMSEEKGGGSLSALPIVETQAGDLSAYVPTNIISITDGQIFLENTLFHQDIRPAINVGLSVSRVGSSAQPKAMRIAGKMKLELAQYREMESFSQFSSDLDQSTQKLLHRGRCMIEMLKQSDETSYSMEDQVVSFFLGANGYLESVSVDDVQSFRKHILEKLYQNHADIMREIQKTKTLAADVAEKLHHAIRNISFDQTKISK